MGTPEEPAEGAAVSPGRAAESVGMLSTAALATAAASYVCIFMPWLGVAGHTVSGWNFEVARAYGLVALAAVLVELLSVVRAWTSRGSELVSFCLVAGAGVLGVSAIADMRWGGLSVGSFSPFEYGAWLGLAFAVLLLALAAVQLTGFWRSAP